VEAAACYVTTANIPVTPGALNGPSPACRYVNVELVGSTAEQAIVGTVLLENPRGKYVITHKELVSQVDICICVFVKMCNQDSFCVSCLFVHTAVTNTTVQDH